MRLVTCVLLAGIVAAAAARQAAAQFVPVRQTRSVSAQSSGFDAYYDDNLQLISNTPINGNTTHSATDFDRFTSSIGAVDQDSTISDTLISGVGHAEGGFSQSPPGYLHHRWSILTSGSSSFSLIFDVPAPTPVLLTGLLHSEGGPFVGDAHITLALGSRNIADFGFPPLQGGDVPVSYAATLPLGRYILTADAADSGAANLNSYSKSSFQFTLQAVPDPGSVAAILCAAPLLLRARRRA